MGLNQGYKAGFLTQVDAALRGDVTYIPNPLDRIDDIYNLMQSRYHLIGGATGSGKTSFVDYSYVLAPWSGFVKDHKEDSDFHWEVIYYSLERKKMFKHAKFVSWMLYRDHGYQLSADDLMGWGKRPINETGYNIIRSYDEEIDELLQYVDIHDGKQSIENIKQTVHARARELGTYFHTNDEGLLIDDSPLLTVEFSGQMEDTKTGKREYLEFTYKEKTYRLYKNDHMYFPHKPKTFVFIVIDGIGLIGGTNFSENKSKLDELSVFLAESRDLYGFSPVVVSQLNRGLGDSTRQKMHGGDLSPQLEDFQGSSQMSHDADVVAALFDPFRYKAYSAEGLYGGYQIMANQTTGGMMAPSGFNRFRSYHVLKNTFGIDGKYFGMKFMGEVNNFTTLPLPDTPELMQVYAEIAQGK